MGGDRHDKVGTYPLENRLMTLKRKVRDIVGIRYRFALFYAFPGGLRFELSDGDSPLDQVLTALRKASVICEDMFRDEERILVHLQAVGSTSRFGFRDMLRELKLAGIIIPEAREIWVDGVNGDGGDGSGNWVDCAFELPVTKLQNLLWCAVVSNVELFRPNPQCRVYLLNARKGLVCHVYDDRGMDIIGQQKSALIELYRRHKECLLPHDMEAMRRTFDPS